MSTRKRVNRSMPLTEVTDRLLTKKEAEANARLNMTCPPLRKKCFSPIGLHKLIVSDEKAQVLSYSKSMTLSPAYNPALNKTYFSQMYRVQDTLGEGSYGVVYRVLSKEDDQSYAIKVSKRCFLNHTSHDEIKLLERIGDHPNIVKYYFAWEEVSRVFMQLELCALSLDSYARRNHSICEDQLWDILIDMIRALSHLHERGLVHLDIKPDNIMMSTDGLYKLGDFGLLFDVKNESGSVTKKHDIVEGDAKYLAKEVLERKVTPAADIFSLGITILELATDVILPVSGNMWQNLRNGSYTEACFHKVPLKLKNTVMKMMAAKPGVRPKAKQILCSTFVKQVLATRSKSPRVNYYDVWEQMNIENMDCKPVRICINPSPSAQLSPSREGNLVNPLSPGNGDDTTPCVTPPRKVSKVIIFNL